MIDENHIKQAIENKNPQWKHNINQYGTAFWVDILIPKNYSFTLQVTPTEGIGVTNTSKRTDEIDFGGHDEVFADINQALNYIERIIT